jgi:hypothetical protein
MLVASLLAGPHPPVPAVGALASAVLLALCRRGRPVVLTGP